VKKDTALYDYLCDLARKNGVSEEWVKEVASRIYGKLMSDLEVVIKNFKEVGRNRK